MNNPYKVLGVNENATQEEIRAAYLQLVKKYHPDRYTDPDLKAVANEKLVEINEAYEFLTKKSSGSANRGPGSGQGYGGGYSGAGSAYAGPKARAFLGQNNLQAAKAVLDSIPIRNAEWYYLYGIIYLRQGWFDKAREYLTIAYQQEPGNAEYASAYNTIRHTGNPYARQAGAYQSNCSPCDICAGAMCFSSFGVPCCCWC